VAASRNDYLSAGLLAVLAFGAGLLITGGPSATQVGTAAVATALILGHLPHAASAAPHVALLVLLGGAGQALLAVAAWPLGRHRPERRALAALYSRLADAARLPVGASPVPPAGLELTAVRQTMYGLGHDHGPSVEAYRVLLDEAERIRREIVLIGALVERLAEEHAPMDAGILRAALGGCADVLDSVAVALRDGREIDPDVRLPARERVAAALTRLERESGTGPGLTRRAGAARLRALAGQLRAVGESGQVAAREGRRGDEQDGWSGSRLRDPLAILRANLAPDSAVLRHALRMAILVAGSDLVVRLADIQRGYWVPLTILVVLRPDFGTTLQRSVMRVGGTIVGLLVASELVHWVPAGDWYQIALIALFCFGLRLAGPGNLGLSAACLAALVVVLLAIDGVPAHATVVDRSLATLAGGGLAILASLIRPAWEREVLSTRLAALLAAYRNYLDVVADLTTDRAALQRARAAARLARTNAQASVDRARAEPGANEAQVGLGESVLANSHRLVRSVLTIDALRPRLREAEPLPELDRLLEQASAALEIGEESLRSGSSVQQAHGLRELQGDLAARLTAPETRDGALGPDGAGALLDATDRLANSLDTLIAVVGERVPSSLP
jgi:uncharacterized membrane protein YccC